MRARIAVLLTIALSLVGLTCSGSAIASEATPAFTPTAEEIVPDSSFTESTLSKAAEIQTYLEKHDPSGCLTHYMTPEPINYFEYSSSKMVPASQVIAFAGTYAETIDPTITLTMLEQQEGLVRGDGPYGCSTVAYETAMGYNCPGPEVEPKTGNCVEEPDNVGFSQQVVKGTWQLEFGFVRSQGNASLGWGSNDDVCYFGPELVGTRQRCIQDAAETFTGKYPIGKTEVTMGNAATATLYAYTPALQPFGSIYLELFSSKEEPPVEEKPKEESKELPKEEKPAEKPAETPPSTTVPSGTPTGMEPAAPVQTPTAPPAQTGPKVGIGTASHESHSKPKAKPKKVCRKHGKKVRCPVKKKTHRKTKKK